MWNVMDNVELKNANKVKQNREWLLMLTSLSSWDAQAISTLIPSLIYSTIFSFNAMSTLQPYFD